MSSEHSAAMVSHSHPIQASSIFHNIRQNKPLISILRAIGTALLVLTVGLCASPAFAVDATLAWDPNTESELEGYGVYYSQNAPGPPYNLFGYVTTDELDDPSNPSFTVTGLVKGARYYIALTAYDATGSESSFSGSVCADVADAITACPSAAVGDSGGSGGGGGGAACFIGTSLSDTGQFDPWIAGLTAFAGMAALVSIAQRRFRRSFLFSRHDARQQNQRRSNLDA